MDIGIETHTHMLLHIHRNTEKGLNGLHQAVTIGTILGTGQEGLKRKEIGGGEDIKKTIAKWGNFRNIMLNKEESKSLH